MPMGAFNYFNYFTEIEEYFWKKRGAHLLVSPLDWAVVETWQKDGVPLTAVLKGIDRAFESYARSRRGAAGRPLKSLAYCVDAVSEAATETQEAAMGAGPATGRPERTEAFSREELRGYLERNRERLAKAAAKVRSAQPALSAPFERTAAALAELDGLLDSPAQLDLEDFERRLTVLEERLIAAMTAGASEEQLVAIHRELDRSLAPFRRKMTADQLAMLERRFREKRLFELFGVPRLSLFYLT